MLAHRPYRLYLEYNCAIFVVKRQSICKRHSWDNRAGLHSLQQHNDPHTFTQQVLTCFESFLLFFAYSITLREPFMCIPSSNSENVNFWGYIYKFWRPWSVQALQDNDCSEFASEFSCHTLWTADVLAPFAQWVLQDRSGGSQNE